MTPKEACFLLAWTCQQWLPYVCRAQVCSSLEQTPQQDLHPLRPYQKPGSRIPLLVSLFLPKYGSPVTLDPSLCHWLQFAGGRRGAAGGTHRHALWPLSDGAGPRLEPIVRNKADMFSLKRKGSGNDGHGSRFDRVLHSETLELMFVGCQGSHHLEFLSHVAMGMGI